MDITKRQISDVLELKLNGRLDAYWSEHLAKAIEESIRQGAHKIQLDMSDLAYLSSAGIRVLLKYFKQLREIKGALTIFQPSPMVLDILELAGLSGLLAKAPAGGAAAKPAAAPEEAKRVEKETTVYFVHHEAKGASLECNLIGNPAKLEKADYGEEDCQGAAFPESSFGLGIGAFGNSFADCEGRFGEFLALGGVAAYLPTDGTNVPDYVISEGLLVPEMEVLYALRWEGRFSHMIRFDAKPEPPGVTALSDVIDFGLATVGAPAAGFVLVAESAGLVGATLKQSPTRKNAGAGGKPLNFPEVREWLSFTAERAFDRTLCVIVGLASRVEIPALSPMLRPVKAGSPILGHFHAAVFPYRPLQRGQIDLYKTINGIFGTEALQSLIHLLADDRDIEGVGESELLRGACWVGPLSSGK